jgi:hypothetical protein
MKMHPRIFISCSMALLLIPVLTAAQDLGSESSDRTAAKFKKVNAKTTRGDRHERLPLPDGLDEVRVVAKIVARERDEITAIKLYSPIVETYIQEVQPDKLLGTTPKSDFYFLGQANFEKDQPKLEAIVKHPHKGSWFFGEFQPAGFMEMIFVDRQWFDEQHYRFEYAGRDFLGEVRCLVFDLAPQQKSKNAGFVGRIWVEDQNFTIVRANGVYAARQGFRWPSLGKGGYFHFDTWRTNVSTGLWLPTYVYIQEIDRRNRTFTNFKAQTRLWGYNLRPISHEEEFSKLVVEDLSEVKDDTGQHDRTPVEAQRAWRHEAENNVLDTLEKNGLFSPPGPVDKVLNTIINNLEITNKLDDQIDLHCRVLLTSTLEVFSVGTTVVISRGLIDVIPDEGTMAAILSQAMADAMVPKPYQDQYGFSDVLRIPTSEVTARFTFKGEKLEAEDHSAKALELLRNSPYVAKLGNAGLFLRQLSFQSKALKELISPRLGNQVFLADRLMNSAPALEPANKDQISALPMGSRIKVDPWTDRIELMKSRPQALLSVREKMPFEVTPFRPYLTRYTGQETSMNVAVSPKQQQSQ